MAVCLPSRLSRSPAWVLALASVFSWTGSTPAQTPAPADSAPLYRPAPSPAPAAPVVENGAAFSPRTAVAPGTPLLPPEAAAFVVPPEAPEVDSAGHPITPPPPPGSMTVPQVIFDSVFGPKSPGQGWSPLGLSNFFTVGWNAPYAEAPTGTNGAPKQFWENTAAGVFARIMWVDFFYTNGLRNVPGEFIKGVPWAPVHPLHTNGNVYTAAYNVFVPINARMELLLVAPFISSNKSAPDGGYDGNFGDLNIEARFHLIEQRNYSLIGWIGERIPTGRFVNGDNINYVTPALEGWWNFAWKWVARGNTGINIITNHPQDIASVYFNNLAVGRYVTDANTPIFKDLALYGTSTILSDVTGQALYTTDVYVGGGFRFGIGQEQKLSASFAVNVPVSGPQAYRWQPNFALVYKW